jgi:hypothetical protein
MSLYETSIPQFRKMLKNLDKWLEAAEAHAKAKSFDSSVLVNARLAPDQYPLVRQVQSACDAAKFTASRLAGKEAPKHPDTETTMEELRARIRASTEYLGTITEKDFVGAETRQVTLPFFPEGKFVTGAEYVTALATPNFYFHLTTAYSILRHNGVAVGKTDYIGSVDMRDK